MKMNPVVLLSNLLAIAVSGLILPAVAQNQPPQNQIAQNQPAPSGQPMQQRPGRGMNNLNLSDAQKTQMKQIKDESKAAIENLLTSEQKTQWQSLKQNGWRQSQKGEGMKALNLSDAQKTQIKQIRDTAKQKMEAILTPDQRTQMQQKRQNKMRRSAQ